MLVRCPSAVRLALALALGLTAGTPGAAVGQQDCKMLFCSPSLTLSPSIVVTGVLERPRVRDVSGGSTRMLESSTQFAVLATLSIPMAIPRTSAFTQIVWTPFADRSPNPFTGYGAAGAEDAELNGNAPIYEFGLQLDLIPARQTGGWLRVDLEAADQFGPAAQPDDAGAYTHKLNLELDAVVSPLRWLARGNWFRNLELYATLDYVATGLPRAGDELPRGGVMYLDDASPWALFAGITIPVAPIAPMR